MAINMPGAKFVSKGIEYVLDYGPKGNLRPYTIGPIIKTATKTRNPYIIGSAIIVVTAVVVVLWAWNKSKIQMVMPKQ